MPHGMSNVQVRRLRSAPKPDTVLACHRSYNSTSNGQLTQHIMVDVFTKTPLVLTNPMLESPAELVLRLGARHVQHTRNSPFNSIRQQKSIESEKNDFEEAPSGDRTHDHTLTKCMLYQLSYGGICTL